MRRRREVREISQVQDSHGNTYAMPIEITDKCMTHLCKKYGPIYADNASMSTLLNIINPVCLTKYAELLENPITSEEILTALR